MTIIIRLIIAFILTALVEGILAYLIRRERRYIVCSILCNFLTNPALNIALIIAFNIWGYFAYIGALMLFEILAIVIEALLYLKLCDMPFPKAVVFSFVLNGCSFFIGSGTLLLINVI
ncbi:MAG: hypothetical protein IJA35_02425 [Clostridia bacterium]|nr:hypothetical protein [Clostridia bacterium]